MTPFADGRTDKRMDSYHSNPRRSVTLFYRGAVSRMSKFTPSPHVHGTDTQEGGRARRSRKSLLVRGYRMVSARLSAGCSRKSEPQHDGTAKRQIIRKSLRQSARDRWSLDKYGSAEGTGSAPKTAVTTEKSLTWITRSVSHSSM